MIDLIHEIAQTIRNNKLRTILTGIAVAWGVFMLVVLLGAVRGVRNAMDDMFSASGNNTMSIYNGRTSKGYKGYKEGRYIQLKESDLETLEKSPVDISETGAKMYGRSVTISGEKDYVSTSLQGVYPQNMKTDRITEIEGRFINHADIDGARKVMVIPSGYAETLFGSKEKALGKTVKAMGLGWKIVGVYTHRWRRQIYVPFTTYDLLTGKKGNVGEVVATVEGLKTETDGDNAVQGIRDALAHKHEFDPEDANAVWVYNSFNNYLSQQEGMGYMQLAGWVIGVLTLLTGIIGVSNIMFVSVRERVHEIGIRRAIGAKPRSVIIQVLSESVAITALFGYMGIVVGMIALQVINVFFGDSEGFKNPTLDISIAIEVTVALIIAGGLAGLFPALKAIKVKPVEALRDE